MYYNVYVLYVFAITSRLRKKPSSHLFHLMFNSVTLDVKFEK